MLLRMFCKMVKMCLNSVFEISKKNFSSIPTWIIYIDDWSLPKNVVLTHSKSIIHTSSCCHWDLFPTCFQRKYLYVLKSIFSRNCTVASTIDEEGNQHGNYGNFWQKFRESNGFTKEVDEILFQKFHIVDGAPSVIV